MSGSRPVWLLWRWLGSGSDADPLRRELVAVVEGDKTARALEPKTARHRYSWEWVWVEMGPGGVRGYGGSGRVT